MPREQTKLVLGRGEVYFNRFAAGTRIGDGERYIGNTPSFRIQRDAERLERASAYRGRRVTRPGTLISESHEVNFTTDHIDIDNIALWFSGDHAVAYAGTTEAETEITETVTVKHGRYYQIGMSLTPFGVASARYIHVYVDDVRIEAAGNFEADADVGRVYILPGAPDITDGSNVEFVFPIRSNDARFTASSPTEIYGSLRFIAFNEGVYGKPQNNLFLPFVRISARGQTDMKGDEFQQWSFDGAAMNLAPGIAQVYAVRRSGSIVLTSDEQAIADELGGLTTFPIWEDRLQVITNEDWPPAVDL